MEQDIHTHISQIAFSVRDLKRSVKFYKRVFGMHDAGHSCAPRKDCPKYLQGIPGVSSHVHWLQDDSHEFQFEFFQFSNNPPAMRKDWKPYDMGMTRIAMEVRNLQGILERARENGAHAVTEPMELNGALYAAVRDPDGILIELKADSSKAKGACPVYVCGVAYSVPDLDKFTENMVKGLRLKQKDADFVDKDIVFDIKNSKRKTAFFDGGKIWIEASQYESPKPNPIRNGYMLTDIGLSHIAVQCDDGADEYLAWFYNDVTKYFNPTSPNPAGEETKERNNICMYTRDLWGLVFEVLYLDEYQGGIFGFSKPTVRQWLTARFYDVVGM